MGSVEMEKELIEVLELNGFVDMSTLNTEAKYKSPTYGLRPFKVKNKELFSAEHFVRLEAWSLNII